MPLLSIADWLKFVVGRSTADQGALTRIMTKVLLRARWTENLCQALYDGWAWSANKRMYVVRELERMTDACDVARRKTFRVTEQLQELWPKPLTEMTVVKLSYQLKLTNHTILYK